MFGPKSDNLCVSGDFKWYQCTVSGLFIISFWIVVALGTVSIGLCLLCCSRLFRRNSQSNWDEEELKKLFASSQPQNYQSDGISLTEKRRAELYQKFGAR
eukprot:TRINITY_DN2024_c0_g1_i4.p1 TRINITY_DN2024_c0_g1~~TRINITY_DN2024_c0_g1_i4.p1  ORF type:complete len:100 (-),score=11.21 TRINITY_DN2024_c0_g1_i4:119-418(-)